MNGRRQTVVFVIEDSTAWGPFWDAFKDGKAIYGMRPVAIGAGDQMAEPAEIVEALGELDPNHPDRNAVRQLIEQADAYSRRAAR